MDKNTAHGATPDLRTPISTLGIRHLCIYLCALLYCPLAVTAETFATEAITAEKAAAETVAAEPIATTLDKLRALDESTPGKLGVYVKNLQTGEEIDYHAERKWYLASLVKIPLAIAVLQAAEKKKLTLDDKIELQQSDFVDGAGKMLNAKPGSRHRISELLQYSVEDGDGTATDMLMRKLGVENFNQQLRRDLDAHTIGPFTTLLQVRRDVYGELHKDAQNLTNTDFIAIRGAGDYPAQVAIFLEKLRLKPAQLQAPTLEEAFARYYRKGRNTGTLRALGGLMERLGRGELLNAEHTHLLLGHMKNATTGEKPARADRQVDRTCNLGFTNARDLSKSVVIVACAEGFGKLEHAEHSFTSIATILVADGRVP